MDKSRGVVCALTGEYADFEEECPSYLEDEKQAMYEFKKKMKFAGDDNEGDPGNFKKNKSNGLLLIVLSGFSFFLSVLFFFNVVVLIVAISGIIRGAVLYNKGEQQEKIVQAEEQKNKS